MSIENKREQLFLKRDVEEVKVSESEWIELQKG